MRRVGAAAACHGQRRGFRPQGIAIPEEHMPPLEGTPQFDTEVNDYYNLRLQQSFWKKDLHSKFLSQEEKEELRRRVAERQARFSRIRRVMVENNEEDAAGKAVKLLTKQYSEQPPEDAPFKQGDRILPLSGPMKDCPATVLGYRDGLVWYQYDHYTHPLPVHPAATRHWAQIGSISPEGELPEGVEEVVAQEAAGEPVSYPKSKKQEAVEEEVLPQIDTAAAPSAVESPVPAAEASPEDKALPGETHAPDTTEADSAPAAQPDTPEPVTETEAAAPVEAEATETQEVTPEAGEEAGAATPEVAEVEAQAADVQDDTPAAEAGAVAPEAQEPATETPVEAQAEAAPVDAGDVAPDADPQAAAAEGGEQVETEPQAAAAEAESQVEAKADVAETGADAAPQEASTSDKPPAEEKGS
eukprot:TRINITY_DN43528_c0_g1_i1.p1 TRINITY_DN43528_c0_g1~~TRINITY_DN43528_c0_g1_i1.p1  ORF type:complete len:439 (+),score=128.51 TRINITY_DN43528_c0_g1_i1:75-1319(+)